MKYYLNMKNLKTILIILYLISLVKTANPPIPEKMYEIVKDTPILVTPTSNLLKRLASSGSMEIQNSTLSTSIYDDYKTEQHQIIIVAKDLDKGYYFTSYGFTTSTSNNFEDIKVTCKILDSSEKCSASYTKSKSGDSNIYKYTFGFKLYNGEQLIIEESHKINKQTQEILYKTESIKIPIFSNSKYCDYKYTIPNGYKFLGFQEGILSKESENVFIYKGECPKESKSDVIRFTPQQSEWKADVGYSLESLTGFGDSVKISFPRYYKGGKNINSFYKISWLDGEELSEDNIIVNYTYFDVEILPSNNKKLGVELHTNFTNKLSNKFEIYFPEKYYQIDENNLDTDISKKAKEIINDKTYYPGKPDYYKLGKFVNNYMTYDLSYTGKEYTPKQIYENKRGVCEHYTKLYNEMLNSIGIKTLYITGWAFQKDETSANKDSIGHAWTAALIDGNWMELDSTWGLFEGIPSGHVLKSFFKDATYYRWPQNINPSKDEFSNIVLISDYSNVNNPIKPVEDAEKTEIIKTDNTKIEPEKPGVVGTDNDENDEEIGKIRVSNSNFIKTTLLALIYICIL